MIARFHVIWAATGPVLFAAMIVAEGSSAHYPLGILGCLVAGGLCGNLAGGRAGFHNHQKGK